MNLNETDTILAGLVAWAAMFPLVVLVRRHLKVPGVGLELAYLGVFFTGHVPGAVLYLLPWYFNIYNGVAVARGFEVSWVGVLAFSGALLLGLLLFRHQLPAAADGPSALEDRRLPWLFFGLGVLSYLVFLPMAGRVSSLTSVVSNLANLQVLGIVLGVWQGLRAGDTRRALLWLALSPVLPVLTLIVGGFLGFGVTALIPVAFFLFTRVRFRWWYTIVIAVALYFGLSLYVTYMQSRGEIRAVVWNEEAYSERVAVVRTEFGDWQWFDWRNQDHLVTVDGRLNQNFLVGVARMNLESGFVRYGEGETLQRALVGFVPRILWPGKPIMAGGNEVVTQYTLIQFAEGTTVAAGQAMEFFINFGYPGVIVGFAAIGLLFAWLDSRGATHLNAGNLYGFLRWYLVGLALLRPTDDLSVMTTGAASAVVTAFLIEFALKWWFGRAATAALPAAVPAVPAFPPR
jgi:hypothetical protein